MSEVAAALRRRLALRQRGARVRRALVERLWPRLGIPIRINTPDRAELEQRILPWLAADKATRRVLFVGCGPYTKHYEQIFARHEYWTIDSAPEKRRFGARGRHVVGSAADLDRHFLAGYFDLIIANGILGFGLADADEIERTFDQFHRALRPAGRLVLGWNDTPPRRPVYPEEIGALARFDRETTPLYDSWRHVSSTLYRHTYDFYVKPGLE